MKLSINDNPYFDLKLQTRNDVYRAVCFSAEKHQTFKRKYESSSPLKLTKFQLKTNQRNNEQEIHINKKSKIMDPQEDEASFDYRNLVTEQQPEEEAVTSVDEAKNMSIDKAKICNIYGRVTFKGTHDEIVTKGKTLRKQEAQITDETGTLRLVLWEGDIEKITSGSTYTLLKAVIKSFRDDNYVTVNRQTVVNPTDQAVQRADEDIHVQELSEITGPATGVQVVQRFLTCNRARCSNNMVIQPEDNSEMIKCTQCNLTQFKARCAVDLYATTLYAKPNNENITLLLKKHILRAMYLATHQEMDAQERFEAINDDGIIHLLLTSNITLKYNESNIVITVSD